MKLRLMKTNAMTLGTRVQRGSGASGVKRGFVGEGDCAEPGWKKEWNLEKEGIPSRENGERKRIRVEME